MPSTEKSTVSSSPGGETANAISERLFALAQSGGMGLYTDIDGTISRIAPTPSAAGVEPRAIAALERISAHGVRVVAITGRAATDAHTLLGLDTLDYAGNHGFELYSGGASWVSDDVARAAHSIAAALDDVRAALPSLGVGILVEDKRYTGSVHYRLAEDQVAAEAALRPLVALVADRHGLVVTEGRLVFEIRPKMHINKGVFTAADIRLHGLQTAAFLGDDITDLDGFHAIRELIEGGELRDGACVGVCAPESARRVVEESDLLADDVDHLCDELCRFSDLLGRDSA